MISREMQDWGGVVGHTDFFSGGTEEPHLYRTWMSAKARENT